MFDLQGQVVLITGAAQGLGWACAEVCALQGASLIVTDRDAQVLDAAVAKLRASGAEVLSCLCDLQHADQIEDLIKSAKAWKGRIDTLVCNAGIQGPSGPIAAVNDAQWKQVMDINLRSAWQLSTGLVPAMAQRGGGSIVFMASLSALRGNKAIGLYALSKAALTQLARNLAVEWGPSNVRCNAVAPGFIRTPLSQELLADPLFMQRRMAATPLRRAGEPHEVAGVVAMLASRAGTYITGQTIVVDGGTLISDGQ